MVCEGIAAVKTGAKISEGFTIEAVAGGACEVIGKTIKEAEEVIESVIHGVTCEMPFSDE